MSGTQTYQVGSRSVFRCLSLSLSLSPFYSDRRDEDSFRTHSSSLSLSLTHTHARKQSNNDQTPDSKKEEFRKYLEKSGVIDALTKVLVGLYEESERPPNAVDYIKRFMGASTGIDIEAVKAENESLKAQNEQLKKAVEDLNGKLEEARKEEEQ